MFDSTKKVPITLTTGYNNVASTLQSHTLLTEREASQYHHWPVQSSFARRGETQPASQYDA
jgi:hypothetical protein